MIAVALAVVVAPAPIPLPAPTLKALQVLVLITIKRKAWQRIWPRMIVVGQCSVYLLTTTPEGWRELELRGSKNVGVSRQINFIHRKYT